MNMPNPRIDRDGRRWYPNPSQTELLWHYEEADTDMGDLTRTELENIFGPTREEPSSD
ncbi:hypothetical protein LRM64_19665 [Prescottella equi]|uniref:hypothetical protein n=1 Tax=Rhodococcus hoagii TaxID=43767 RepID=UPI0021D4B23B|nr:hypothetical protein [Prescottella equi]MCU7527420.1 hypothetical protein [Prescottella equi]MCU7535909.1 hypothetical protein [Prescottella equi]